MNLKIESYSIFSSHVQPISVHTFTYFLGEVAISSSQSSGLIIFNQKIVSHYFLLHLIMMTLLLLFLQSVSVITCWWIIDIGVFLFNSHFRPQIRIGIHVYMMKLPSCSTRYSINCMLRRELLINKLH